MLEGADANIVEAFFTEDLAEVVDLCSEWGHDYDVFMLEMVISRLGVQCGQRAPIDVSKEVHNRS